jgi:hypothetical protein
MREFWLSLSILIAMPGAAIAAESAQTLPARFEADRIFVVPKTADGTEIRFFTDSGGGYFISKEMADRLHLPTQSVASDAADDKDAKPTSMATLPTFQRDATIPLSVEGDGKIAVMSMDSVPPVLRDADGMLGEVWFGGRIWTWDYPGKTLRIEGTRWKPNASTPHVSLGFPTENNARADNFARIAIAVDGKSFDVLLDTGASTMLTDEALKAVDDKRPARRATSFIVDSIFKDWRAKHPDWRVIENAEAGTKAAMIEVPLVEIAGSRVGPVWFTWRPDKNFHDYMSGMMDGKVEGAIGGDAFNHFVMTIDYPKAVAYFRCTKDCKTK